MANPEIIEVPVFDVRVSDIRSTNVDMTAYHPPIEASSIMANPPSVYLDEDFLQNFHKVDDAIRHDNLEEVLRHVEKRVNLSDDAVLSAVIACGRSKLALDLLEKMPAEKLMVKNFDEDTALHVAVAKGEEGVVEALVNKNRGLLRTRNKQREFPLHKAALFGQKRIFWKLVEHGSDADAREKEGATMLHCAIMGNAPELALEIARTYPKQVLSRNSKAVTPLQLMVTIPEALPSQSHLGPLESLIYKWIPLEKRHEKHAEESSVHKTPYPRYKDDECLPYVITPRRKFPCNYATFFGMLELASVPVRWVRILVFNILKQLSTRIQELERLKKNHEQAMELIAYLAKDPRYWDFIDMGRTPEESQISRTPSGAIDPPAAPPDIGNQISGTPSGASDLPAVPPDTGSQISGTPWGASELPAAPPEDSQKNRSNESALSLRTENDLRAFVKQVLTVYQEITAEKKAHAEDSKKNRWNESPLILGVEMGLYEFVKQILKVCPASATHRDTEGRNVLQVAIQKGHEEVVELIASMAKGSNPVLPSWLLSEIEGKTKNTILHFAAVPTVQDNYPATQMQYELQWFEKVEKLVRPDLKYSRNKEEKTAQELFNEEHKPMVQKCKEQLMEMGKTYSGLVAAVVFASSFSIPGDKDVNNNPVFLHRTAFKVFSHAYVIGLSCATTALVLFLSLLTSPYRVQEFRRSLPTKYFFANLSFSFALVALLVAFTCNIYLNIYGGRKAERKDIIPLVCELTIFPAVCAFVILYRGSSFAFGSFVRHVWR